MKHKNSYVKNQHHLWSACFYANFSLFMINCVFFIYFISLNLISFVKWWEKNITHPLRLCVHDTQYVLFLDVCYIVFWYHHHHHHCVRMQTVHQLMDDTIMVHVSHAAVSVLPSWYHADNILQIDRLDVTERDRGGEKNVS